MEATIASSRFHHQPKLSNPPSLPDTSTTTTESWSTVSAGRRTPQQQQISYPSSSQLSERPRPQTFRSQSPTHILSASQTSSHAVRGPSNPPSPFRQPGPVPPLQYRDHHGFLEEQQLEELQYHYTEQSPRVTRSEPGQILNSNSMEDYVHRMAD